MTPRAPLLVLCLTTLSCSNETESETTEPEPEVAEEPPTEQPHDWDLGLALPVPEDLNDAPNILEVDLEAYLQDIELQPGIMTEMWTYNGGVPGPLLRARKGDRLVVHFTNSLPEPTTIHWHGLRVPNDMDGTEAVQNPVQPGDTFTYDFELLDAGTFWYHPHVNSGAQVGFGLYGPIVVDDPDDPVTADDIVVVLSDVSLTEDGQLQPGDENGWFGDYFGREGELLLVNGRVLPDLGIRPGLPQRWRVINAARARFFGLTVPGAKTVRIGGDSGLIEHPLPLDQLVIHPSERAELLVTVNDTSNTEVIVPFQDVDRFEINLEEPDIPLIRLKVAPEASDPAPPLPETLRAFADVDTDHLPTRSIALGETSSGEMTINGVVFPGLEDEHQTGFVGDTEIWEIHNETGYSHPFHLHGFEFEVIDVGGVAWPVRELKDTTNIPPRQTLRFVVRYDDRPGHWMFHCHILGHAKLGMMSILDIQEH